MSEKIHESVVLLVHPLGYSVRDAGADISRKANIMPPLGLASIAAYLEQHGKHPLIVDCFAKPDSDTVIRDRLLEHRPGFLGLSCTTSSFLDGVRIASMAKEILPGIKVVFGGVHVSALKESMMADYPVIDFIIVGEGEKTLLELMESRGEDVETIPGLIFRTGSGDIRFNGYRRKGLDLDTLPFPAYEKLEGYPEAYTLPLFNYPSVPNTSALSSRGCPYACSYCDRSVFRRTYRFNSAQYLYDHMAYLKDRFKIKHINFYDDQFTFNQDRIREFLTSLIDHPLKMTFNCAARANHIDEDVIRLMKEAGCWMISLGIETGDQDLLSKHGRDINLDMLAEKIRLIKKHHIRVKGLLMMGLPGETEETIKKTREYAFSLPIDDFNLTKFTPFPGSPIYENLQEKGEFEDDWNKMDCMHFLFVPRGLTKERMEELYIDFYREHFKRFKTIWGYVTMLWKSPNSWWRFVKNGGSFIKFAFSNKRYGGEEQ